MEPEVCAAGPPPGLDGLEAVLSKDLSEKMATVESSTGGGAEENAAAQPGDKTVSTVDVSRDDLLRSLETRSSFFSDYDYCMVSLSMPPVDYLFSVDVKPLQFSEGHEDKPAVDKSPPLLQDLQLCPEDFSFSRQEVFQGEDLLTGIVEGNESVQDELLQNDTARQETSQETFDIDDDIVEKKHFKEESVVQEELFQVDTARQETSQKDIAKVEHFKEERVVQGELLQDYTVQQETTQENDIKMEHFKEESVVQEELFQVDTARQETSQKDIAKVEHFKEERVVQGKLLQDYTVQQETSQENDIKMEYFEEVRVVQEELLQDDSVQQETSQENDIKMEYFEEGRVVHGEPYQKSTLQENGVKSETVEKSALESTYEEISVVESARSLENGVREDTVMEVETTDCEISRSATPVGLNAENGTAQAKFSTEELRKIWELAKKLCEARHVYNEKVCRLKGVATNMKLQKNDRRKGPVKMLTSGRRNCAPNRCRAPNTNVGVCTIGQGENWDDPPVWDWGQPMPKELSEAVSEAASEIIPSVPPPETPTISLEDDDFDTSLSSCHRSPGPKRFGISSKSKRSRRLPTSKSVKISISVTTHNSSEPVTLSDSDDDLPDFSMELGIPKKMGASSRKYYDIPTGGRICTVINSPVVQLAPTTRLHRRKRMLATENRAPNRNLNPQEVVVLSDDSDDGEVEVLQVAKKQGRNPAPERPNPTTEKEEAESKDEWSCPICLETKDKVKNIMSTTCGHIFCGPCLQSTVQINKQCPNCRRKLTLRQIHNLYM